MRNGKGRIIIPGGLDIWPHELKTAEALANAGYTVEFIQASTRENERSADALINGQKWEFKAPRSSLIKAVERNLKKANRQCDRIVFDSRRMKHVPDRAIVRELEKRLSIQKSIKAILFVNRHGLVIDIITPAQ